MSAVNKFNQYSNTLMGYDRQRGFSLTELMISTLIGTIVVAAALSLFTTNQRTFNLQQSKTDVQQQGRFALDYMSADIRRMGFNFDATDPASVLLDLANSSNGDFPVNDQLTFGFLLEADGDLDGVPADCEGNTVAVDTHIRQTYNVVANQLFCTSSVGGGAGVMLVDNVESFQVLVGVDDGANGQLVVNQYKTINTVLATDEVAAIKVALLIGANQSTSANLAIGRNLQVLDNTIADNDAALTPNQFRRIFSSTIRMRNYNTDAI